MRIPKLLLCPTALEALPTNKSVHAKHFIKWIITFLLDKSNCNYPSKNSNTFYPFYINAKTNFKQLLKVSFNYPIVGVFTVALPRDAPGKRLFGDRSPDLEHEGKRNDTRHKFRQDWAARIA